MSAEDAETALANAAAAVAAAAAAQPADQAAQHHLAQAQLMALQHTHADQGHDGDADGYNPSADGQQLSRKPRKLRKPNDVARCQVDGCGRDLSDGKLYLRRYSVCEPHFKAEWVMLGGGRFRFCQQCNKFQPLDNFTGNRRSCKARSEDRNLRRRKQRTDERAAAGDDGDMGVGAGRLAKGGPNLGGLTVPQRAALGDNGMLRQLGADPPDPNAALGQQLQYVSQMQQLLLAGGAGAGLPGIVAVAGGAGAGGGGPGMQVQVPAGVDLAALVGGDLSALSGASPNSNALTLLSAAAAASGAAAGRVIPSGTTAAAGSAPVGGAFATLADPTVSNNVNVLQQLQLAQLASALTKGGVITAANGAMPAIAAGGTAATAAAAGAGLASALGSVGVSMGLGAGAGLAAGLSGNALTQQLLVQQAAAMGGGGLGAAGLNGAAGPGGIVPLTDASGLGGNLDLQSLMTQQLLQQTAGSNPPQPVLVLHNQNVMLLSLDSLGLLQQQAK